MSRKSPTQLAATRPVRPVHGAVAAIGGAAVIPAVPVRGAAEAVPVEVPEEAGRIELSSYGIIDYG